MQGMTSGGHGRVIVRRATAADTPHCASIYLVARRATFSWVPPEIFTLEDYEASVHDEEVWVAEVDGAVVGFVSIYRPESFVHNLFVDPQWQHRGIGGMLLEQALRRMNRPARLKCVASNRQACAFYEKLGLVEEARGRADLGPFIVYRR